MTWLRGVGEFLQTRFGRGDRPSGQWPFVSGRYHVLDVDAPVVVAVAGEEAVAEDLAGVAPLGLSMVALLRTGGDIERLARNIASNLSIQYLLIVGADAKRKALGNALLVLTDDGGSSDEETASLLRSLRSKLDEEALRDLSKQIRTIDMLGCDDLDKILARIAQLAADAKRPNTGFVAPGGGAEEGVERVIAARNMTYASPPDKGGDFKIRVDGKAIVVEHGNSKNGTLRIIEGVTARDICLTLIRNGWVTKLDHAAYLGRELARAEFALNQGLPFTQDDGRPIGAATGGG